LKEAGESPLSFVQELELLKLVAKSEHPSAVAEVAGLIATVVARTDSTMAEH